MKSIIKNIVILLLFCSLILGLCCSCANNEEKYYSSIDEIADKRISVWQGFTHATYMQENYPNADYYYFGDINLMYEALNTNKIDAFGYEECFLKFAQNMNLDVDYIQNLDYPTQYGFIFAPTDNAKRILKEFNDFLDEYKKSGKLAVLVDKWILSGETIGLTGVNEWDTSNGELNVVTTASQVPFHYLYEGEFSGYEAALIAEFCKVMHYKMNVTVSQWDAMLAEVQNGKADLGASCIELSEDHKAAFDMSNSTYDGNFVLYVKANPINEPKFSNKEELNGKVAASVAGSIDDDIIKESFIDPQIDSYPTVTEAVFAVSAGKADYALSQIGVINDLMAQIDGLTYLDEPIFNQHVGAIFNKNDSKSQKLLKEFNQFLAEIKESGELDAIKAKWINAPNDVELPKREFSGETVDIAISPYELPYAFVRSGENVGIEVELSDYFCEKYGYTPNYFAMDFSGVILSVSSSKCDFSLANVTITDERLKSVNFSDSYADVPLYLVVPTKGTNSKSFVDSFKTSFNRTFIEEDRYKMFISGIITTLEITLAAAVIGTIFGFIFYMICRKGNKLLNSFFDIFSRLMAGLPMVVILMILYYVIFGSSNLSGAIVSTIGFGLSIALSVYSNLKVSVLSIDPGQIEGAYAIGFTDIETFFRIILPQALESFMPMYKGDIIALINGTAIVGFIAVQDLTKMSDLIRARTYEAFFPLIATALIYLVLGILLTAIVKCIQFKFEPERRSKEQIIKSFQK